MFVKCGMVVRAGEELVKVRDLEGLEGLKGKARAGEVGEVERLIGMVRPRR